MLLLRQECLLPSIPASILSSFSYGQRATDHIVWCLFLFLASKPESKSWGFSMVRHGKNQYFVKAVTILHHHCIVNQALLLQDQPWSMKCIGSPHPYLRVSFPQHFPLHTCQHFVRLPTSFSNPISLCWSFLQGRVLKSAQTELSPASPSEKNPWPFSPFWILLPASPSVWPDLWLGHRCDPVSGSDMKDHFHPATCLWPPRAHHWSFIFLTC